jgi:DNA-binding NarL/FixJ family response regulator
MNVVEATAMIQRLEAEVRRLEHALTSAELLAALIAPASPPPPLNLPPRDRQVLEHIFKGDTNQQIGQALYITPPTVATHLRRLSKRFGTHTRTGTAMAAIRAGFTPNQQEEPT